MAQKKEQVFLSVVVQGTDKIVGMKQQMVELKKAISKTRTELKQEGADLQDLSRKLAQQEVNLKKTTKLYREEQKAILSSNKAKKDASSFTMKMATAFGAAQIASNLFMRAMGALRQAVKNGIVTFKDFEFQMAKVKAISGANEKEFQRLEASAKKLGRTTFFTASQVGELQLNLSKLGFRPQEILEAQEAILMLSTAMGEDLGRTATVVAATIRGFGEDTDQTARFANAMAAAFANSALDIEKFQTSMSKVSAIAATAGFSFEETTGLLALLTDRGIEASIAGTSLRNILLKLQNPSSELALKLGRTVHSGEDFIVALKELESQGINVAGVMEIVDDRQVQAMESFIRGADTLTDFNKIMSDSEDAAKEMAGVMENTLGGALLQLQAAYEGFILVMQDGNGLLQQFVKLTANTLNLWADALSSPEQAGVQRAMEDFKSATERVKEANDELEEANKKSDAAPKKLKLLSDELKKLQEDNLALLEHYKARLDGLEGEFLNPLQMLGLQKTDVDKAENNVKRVQANFDSMAEMIETQLEKEKKAADEKEELANQEAIAASKLSKQLEKLQQRQKDLVDRGDHLNEIGKAKLAQTNQQILAIQEQIKALKELGVEEKKQKIDFGVPKANIGEGFAALVKDRMAELDAEIKEKEAELMKDYVDGRIGSEAELQEAIFEMKLKVYEAEQNLINQTSIAHDAAGKMIIQMEGKKKLSAEQTAEANRKQGEQLIENAIMGAQSVEEAFASVVSVKINEILLNALSSMFEDKTIPFFAKLALGLGMKSIVTPMINNLIGVGGGGSSQVETQGTFAKGGLTNGGMFQGASHANGGVKFAVGGRIMEAEGGEAIINKRSTARFRPILSAINSYNGNGVKFADGGLINSGEKFAMGGELRSIQQMVSGGGSSKVVMVESDVTKTQGRVSSLEAQASF